MTLAPLIDFQDAVTAANLDPNQKHAVFYADGPFANRTAVAAHCPQAKLYGITTWGQTGQGIFACDSETLDLTVPQTIAWVAEQVRLGVKLICVYANLNRWINEGLLAALAKYKGRIRRWVAHYTNVRQIEPWADAEQYANPGPIDRNVALANFFGDATPVPSFHYERYDTKRRVLLGGSSEDRLAREYDRWRATQTPTQHPHRARLAVLRGLLRIAAGRVYAVAHAKRPPSWDTNHRGFRFKYLRARAKGESV